MPDYKMRVMSYGPLKNPDNDYEIAVWASDLEQLIREAEQDCWERSTQPDKCQEQYNKLRTKYGLAHE